MMTHEEAQAMSDGDLNQALSVVSQELASRSRLAAIPKKIDSLNRDFLAASGISEGSDWAQPTGAHDAYPDGWVTRHQGKEWRSLIPGNVWEPGVSGWREQVVDPETGEPGTGAWVQPTGAHDAYPAGELVTHDGKVWVSSIDANVWEPGVHGWEEQVTAEEPEPEPEAPVTPEPEPEPTPEPVVPVVPVAPAVADWKQPTGGHDAYKKGDKVTYNGVVYTSTSDGNVWAPGVYGWVAA